VTALHMKSSTQKEPHFQVHNSTTSISNISKSLLMCVALHRFLS